VYELIGQNWQDQGTAFCMYLFDETTQEPYLVARAESDFQKVVLKTTIRPVHTYQRQQDTLIVWTEPSGADYALSFQDPDGCLEIWHFILDVQALNGGDGTGCSCALPRWR
jgi:protein phosphatase-4 regulatory subunit 3